METLRDIPMHSFAGESGHAQSRLLRDVASIAPEYHPLLLFSKGDVHNRSGVAYDADGVVLVDPGGGEWSHRRLQDMSNQLSKLRFALMRPQDVTRLIDEPSSNHCVESAG